MIFLCIYLQDNDLFTHPSINGRFIFVFLHKPQIYLRNSPCINKLLIHLPKPTPLLPFFPTTYKRKKREKNNGRGRGRECWNYTTSLAKRIQAHVVTGQRLTSLCLHSPCLWCWLHNGPPLGRPDRWGRGGGERGSVGRGEGRRGGEERVGRGRERRER